MVNLKAIYGEQAFDRKTSYRNVRFIPLLSGVLVDFLIAWAIVRFFLLAGTTLSFKVYAILCLFGILRHILSYFIDLVNYKLVIKKTFESEIRHYLRLFGGSVDWDEIATYDDFFLQHLLAKHCLLT